MPLLPFRARRIILNMTMERICTPYPIKGNTEKQTITK